MGKGAGGFLAKAGKNMLESDQFSMDIPKLDMGFGVAQPTKKSKKHKKKDDQYNPFIF
jgi:hypothetical protein